uniref:Protein E7 n=1 Tax=Mops bat papillomavirus TaxID=3141892 RepID=A0AAU7E302_9PAPI
MIGKEATLREIVLEEQPEPVSLTCHETLDEEEPTTPYKISVPCSDCPRMLRIAVQCTSGGIQILQTHLLRDIFLTCSPCAIKKRYYG